MVYCFDFYCSTVLGPSWRLVVSATFYAAPVPVGHICNRHKLRGYALVYWPNPFCYVPAILVELLPLSGRFIYEGDQVHVVLGMIIAFFAVILIVMGEPYALDELRDPRVRIRNKQSR